MKNVFLLIMMCSIFNWNSSYGQEFKYKKGIDKYVFKDARGKTQKEILFDEVKPCNKEGWFVRNGTEWGLVNDAGELIIEIEYEQIKENFIGQIVVKKNHFFGLFQNDGEKNIRY